MYLPLQFLLLSNVLGSLATGGVSYLNTKGRKTCTVTAQGDRKDDTPNLMKAFEDCGTNGLVVFPEDQNYWIGTKLNPYDPLL